MSPAHPKIGGKMQGGATGFAEDAEPIGARSAHGGKFNRGAAGFAEDAEPIGARSAHGGKSPKEAQEHD